MREGKAMRKASMDGWKVGGRWKGEEEGKEAGGGRRKGRSEWRKGREGGEIVKEEGGRNNTAAGRIKEIT